MVNWCEIAYEGDSDKLRQAKEWLFQENVRLENEKRELEAAKERFLNERVTLRRELDELNRRTLLERKRLKEENLFFDKKMAILQDGFRQLDLDRKSFENQKRTYIQEQNNRTKSQESSMLQEEFIKRLFHGINNPLALRKRYKDLIKIFHPDNIFGDEELVRMINKEYQRRREEQ